MTPRISRFADNEKWLGRVMIAPAIVYIAVVVGFPIKFNFQVAHFLK